MAVPEHSLIVDFLNIDIENDDEIVDLIKFNRIESVINYSSVMDFIIDWNDEYCAAHDLCPECRTPLEEIFVEVPYGDTSVQESEGLRCPYCG